MKCALIVALFRLFTIGVLTDGLMEQVLVKDGNSVTLKSGLNKRHINDGIDWNFNGKVIIKISGGSTRIQDKSDGSFRGKLKLDEQSGDLKISNISTTEAGQYKPDINSPDGTTLDVTFTVKVVSDAEAKPVTVMKGDSVTLLPDLTGIERHGEIQWRFGNKTLSVHESFLTITSIKTEDTGLYEADITSSSSRYIIHQTFYVTISVVSDAEAKPVTVMKGDSVTLLPDLTGIERHGEIQWRFGNKTLSVHESSLTITSIRTEDTGLYEANITSSSSRYNIHRKQSFSVTVSGKDAVKSVSTKKGDSVNLQIDTIIQNYEQIQWLFGNEIIVQINKTSEQPIKGSDETFRHRLELDHQTGSLTITNTINTDSGHYTWRCKSSRYIIDRTTYVSVVSDPGPHSGLHPAVVAVIALLGVAVSFAAGAIFFKKCGQNRQSVLNSPQQSSQLLEENGGNRNNQNTEDPDGEEMHCTNP